MKSRNSIIIGMVVLGLVFAWLAWGTFASPGGFNLKNILIVAMAGIIIFVPLYKKMNKGKNGST